LPPRRTRIPDCRPQLLAIYLNDHLAGATLGVELARRLRASNHGDSRFGEPLTEICRQIEQDRSTLEGVMDVVGARRGRVKPAGAWVAEKLGRLKLNGRMRGYSPLSRLVELEMLLIGITGKIQLWHALGRALGGSVGEHDFDRLAERASAQQDVVKGLHDAAAAQALTEDA
jgi:hypothetical protein